MSDLMEQTPAKKQNIGKYIFKRYLVDAMSYMALGLFSSLIIGTILSQIASLTGSAILTQIASVTGATQPVTGCAIGVAIALGFKCDPLVVFTSAASGAVGYMAGGPVGAYISGVIGAELGRLVSKKTPVDVIVTPLVTLVGGGFFGAITGPYVQNFMAWLGNIVNVSTELNQIPMGIIVAVVVGMVLTLPISSAALCIMMGISGLAAGAATVGCCCQMIGFAVAGYRDNGVGGLLSVGLGTSMLQVPNILRNPRIWIAPTLASAILGPISTAVLGMTNVAAGAGMGTSGLVGVITTFSTMGGQVPTPTLIAEVLIMHFVAPAVLTLLFDFILRKIKWVKPGDMKLYIGN